jgi:hypothetical protein
MSVVLAPLDVSFAEEPAEPVEQEEEQTEQATGMVLPQAPLGNPEPEPVEEAPLRLRRTEGETPEPLEPQPVPKKRGRPPNVKVDAPGLEKVTKAKPKPKAKPKAPPPEESDSDVDETLRNVYNHVAKPDMETAILEFLVNRKQGETQRRRQLWSQLAQM